MDEPVSFDEYLRGCRKSWFRGFGGFSGFRKNIHFIENQWFDNNALNLLNFSKPAKPAFATSSFYMFQYSIFSSFLLPLFFAIPSAT